jgi:hypothetical protein
MKLKIEIKMDNAAFEPDNGTEAARILRKLADEMDGGNYPACSIVKPLTGFPSPLRDNHG